MIINQDNRIIKCDHCGKESQKTTKEWNKSQKCKNHFCDRKCQNEFQNKEVEVKCQECGTAFSKKQHEIARTKNNFCSRSCAAIYNNKHKKHGTRRSKLEKWLEKQLTQLYPNLEIHFNRKDAIESELDIYIPSLKLAFELNGIFHYEPIYGQEKLAQIQNNDTNKFQACQEKDISLCIIDTSSQKYFKSKSSEKFLNIITEIIEANRR
jgi:hypothetical protein